MFSRDVYIIGIDCGLSAEKVSLYDFTGKEIGTVSGNVRLIYSLPGYVECDMESNWRVVAGLVRKLLKVTGVKPKNIIGVCCTGHGNGLYLLDRYKKPRRYGITSMDNRAASVLNGWKNEDLNSKTRPINGQDFWSGQTIALLRWLKIKEPETYRSTTSVLCFKDYIRYKLTGEIASDYSEMSKVGLIDLQNRSYSKELLGILGISDIIKSLPPLVESTEICGWINKEASISTGLSSGTPVVAGLADIDACALGTGAVRPGEMCIITGTWSINEILTDKFVESKDLFGLSLYPVPGIYLALAASTTSASNLSWFIEQLLPLERTSSEKRGKSIYEYCDYMVKSCRAEECGITFHPFLYGSDRRTDASAAFLGVKGWSSRKDMLRAVYEGIAFAHKTHVDQLRSGVGIPVSATRLAGGLSRSPVWAQILCDVLGIALEISTDSEIGTKGCMLCSAVGVGLYKNFADAVSKSVVQKKSFKPRKDMKAHYQKKYLFFKDSVEKMEPIWNLFAQQTIKN